MRQLPNILTLSNLFFGCLACIIAIKGGNSYYILWLLAGSLIFDFFDGFIARAVKASGALGKELDSLADVISFGFLPGLLMMNLLNSSSILKIQDLEIVKNIFSSPENFSILGFLGLSITLASAYRLAKFNLDEEQSYYFKGMPTPANTLFIFSIYWIIKNNPDAFWNHSWLLILICICCTFLPICNLPMIALKFKSFRWKNNELIFVFLGVAILGFLFLRLNAIPFIIIFYILLSIIFRNKIINKKSKI